MEETKQENSKISNKILLTLVLSLAAALLVVTVVLITLFNTLTDTKENNKKDRTDKSDSTSETKPAKQEEVLKNVAATMGDYTLTNSQLQVFYWMQLYEMLDYYGSYAEYYLGIDLSKPLDEQVYNSSTGQTWHEYLLDAALDSWHRYHAVYVEAKNAEYQLPEDYQEKFANLETELQTAATESGHESVDAMLQSQYGQGVSYADYYYYLEIRYTAEAYFTQVVSELEFTQEELEEYFQKNEAELAGYGITKETAKLVDFRNILLKPAENTADAWYTCFENMQALLDAWNSSDMSEDIFAALAKIKSQDTTSASNGGLYQYVGKNKWATVDARHILVMPKGDKTEADWEECRAAAQAILDQYLTGTQSEDAFGALANEKSEDQGGMVTNGGLYTDIYVGQMVKAFEDWIFDDSRTPGETGLVKTEYGYHVMYFVKRNGPVDDWLYADGRTAGDCEMVKTDDGYQLLYYVGDTIAWEAWCRQGLQTEGSQNLMNSYLENHKITAHRENIAFGEAPKLK